MDITLNKATDKDIETIKTLLKENDLPYQDINIETMELYLANAKEDFIGIIGFEYFNQIALLRSMVINKQHRNQGYGKRLCLIALTMAQDKNIEEIYVLTCSAKEFFRRVGFREIERNNAPNSIKNTAQFLGLCPQSATCLTISTK